MAGKTDLEAIAAFAATPFGYRSAFPVGIFSGPLRDVGFVMGPQGLKEQD